MEENKIVFNKIYFGFFIYTIWVLFVEWINFFLYFINNDLPLGIAELVSALITTLLVYLFRKKITFKKLKSNIEIIEVAIGITLIAIYTILMGVYADVGYDTFNYHLIAQNPKFENYFTEDYGYGHFQVWGFRLPNRLFYYFRIILGYRLGTIVNPLSMIASFAVLYDLLSYLENKINFNGNKWVKEILCNKLLWSLVILFQFDTIIMEGSYYVEALVLPFALEMITILIKNEKQTMLKFQYFALICGLNIAFKMTNVVFVVPCLLIFIAEQVYRTNPINWLIAIFVGLFPFALYLMFNYACTKNPVFPYFNEIFQSPYFINLDFKDTRWGPSDEFETKLWLLYTLVLPNYRQSEIFQNFNFTLLLGYIFALFIVFVPIYDLIRKRKINYWSCFIVVFVALTSGVFWSYSTGYSRYYLFGKILWALVAYYGCLVLCMKTDVARWVFNIISIILVICTLSANLATAIHGNTWAWKSFNIDTYKKEVSMVLWDNDKIKKYGIKPEVFYITNQERMGVCELVNPDAFVINRSYLSTSTYGYEEAVGDLLTTSNSIYDIYYKHLNDFESYMNLLNSEHFYVESIKHIFVSCEEYNFVKIRYDENAYNSWVVYQDNISLSYTGESKITTLSFIGGRYYAWESEKDRDLRVEVYIVRGEEKILANEIYISTIYPKNYNIELNLEYGDQVVFEAYTPEDKYIDSSEPDKIILINPTFN